MRTRPRVLRILEEYVLEEDATPWWTTLEDVDEYGYLDPDELRELGLSDGLIRDGQVWNEDWDAAASAAMHRGDDKVDPELRRRGIELARRTVEEVPTLWVLDPAGDWHIGAEQLVWPLEKREFEEQPVLLLGLPEDEDDVWPWRFQPAYSVPGDEWGVPLPSNLGWGNEILAATQEYAVAASSATDIGRIQEAQRLALRALEAMQAATGWMGEDAYRPIDTTGRRPVLEDLDDYWPRARAKPLRRALKKFAKTVPGPGKPVVGEWFAYAPLSGETFEGD